MTKPQRFDERSHEHAETIAELAEGFTREAPEGLRAEVAPGLVLLLLRFRCDACEAARVSTGDSSGMACLAVRFASVPRVCERWRAYTEEHAAHNRRAVNTKKKDKTNGQQESFF